MAPILTFDDAREAAEKACRNGQFAEADRIYAQLFADDQDRPPCSPKEAAVLRRGHAVALYGLRRFADAEAQLQRALDGYADAPMAPETVANLSALADAIGEQGGWIEAEALARDAVRRGETALGAQHEATLGGRLCLAWIHSRQEHWEEAAQLAEDIHADMAQVLGAEHRLTLSAGHLLSTCLLHASAPERAEAQATAVFHARKTLLGPDHPHTIAIAEVLARTRLATGQVEEAARLAEEFLPTATRRLSEDHPVTTGLREIQGTLTHRRNDRINPTKKGMDFVNHAELPLLSSDASRWATHLPVNEVFWDVVQGEGPYMGRVCAFIRLGYCNLHCPPCDTKPTWDTSQYNLEETCPDTAVDAVVGRIPGNVRMVVLTGGEPLLWQRTPAFAALLTLLRERAIEVHVETNGTIAPVPETDALIRHYSVSPKLSAMGGADPHKRRIKPEVITAFARIAADGRAAFKFVTADAGHVAEVEDFAVRHGLKPSWIWVMPEAEDTATLLDRQPVITGEGVRRGFNVSTRLHKIAQCR